MRLKELNPQGLLKYITCRFSRLPGHWTGTGLGSVTEPWVAGHLEFVHLRMSCPGPPAPPITSPVPQTDHPGTTTRVTATELPADFRHMLLCWHPASRSKREALTLTQRTSSATTLVLEGPPLCCCFRLKPFLHYAMDTQVNTSHTASVSSEKITISK